jgi:NADPH:quinone reductase-like Zn-dependent oxidoreductase
VKLSSYDGIPTSDTLAKLNRLIEAGPFHVHVARTFPLDRAADAQRGLEEHYLGKLALKPN